MFEKLKHIKYETVKHITVIGVHFSGNATHYRLLQLQKKGDSLSILNETKEISFEALQELSKNTPLLLAFSGKGIISKKVGNKGNYLKEIIFNASAEDFYTYQVLSATHNFVSVARKEVIDEVLEKFRTLDFQIVDFSIGPFVASRLAFLEKQALPVQDYILQLNENTVVAFQKSNENQTITIDDETIETNSLTLLATAIQYSYPSEEILYDDGSILEDRETFKYKKRFNRLAITTLLFFLITLLGSYIALLYYNDQYVNYNSQLKNLNDTYSKVKELKDEQLQKQAILNESGTLTNAFLSQYTFEIGKTVPKTINLTSLEVNPLQNRLKQNEKLLFNTNQIVLSGETKESAMLNYWVKDLKKLQWVSKIEIVSFKRNRKQVGLFTVKIDL